MSMLTLEDAVSQYKTDSSLSQRNDLVFELPKLTCKFIRSPPPFPCMENPGKYTITVQLDDKTFNLYKEFYVKFIQDDYTPTVPFFHLRVPYDQLALVTSQIGTVDLEKLVDTQFVASCCFELKDNSWMNKNCRRMVLKGCDILTQPVQFK